VDVSLGVLARRRLNFDFGASFTPEQQSRGGIEYNYRREAAVDAERALEGRETGQWREDAEDGGDGGPVAAMAATCGTDAATYTRERPGMSAFAREDGTVYHTYSTYSRGLDALWGMYQWLDRAPMGRNEAGIWWRRRDEYGKR
jgi:predicted dithiol-disulfide oxidoreductase (DUF899 family)